uniref:Retrovirus-related Pol polyprotein from transposon TNT 1-94 n=1 Tax=Tanacetum cinerariifolium TaxID=118510 RepID=A0A6L2JP91_TANCI|nr:hypothetical protein [Tanacetum cinerariifolium]
MSPENKAHFESKKKPVHLILTRIRDEIYSTVDACKTAHEMWEAIERLQQGESLNIQDVKTNLFWEFGKFTSHDGETMESYYTRNAGSQKGLKTTYHKEKMLLCKEAEKGVHLQVEQSDWQADMDEEIDEQELEAYYSYMEKIHEVPTTNSRTDSEPLEQNDQNVIEGDDELVALANLIANLKINVDENKKIQKQLKKANTTLAHELTECKSILVETSRTLKESNSIRDSCLVALQNKQTEFKKNAQSKKPCLYKIPNDQSDLANRLVPDREETLTLERENRSKLNKDLVESLKKEIDKLESDKAEFSNMYDMLLHEFTVRFGNDQFALILGYGYLVQGNITINRVFYLEGLNHNLFSVGQFCYANLETASLTLICLIAKALTTQEWLWHRRLSHLNVDYINLLSKKDIVISLPKLKYVKDQLCSSYKVSKAKISSFKTKTIPSSKGQLNLLHMDLCGPMRVASINGKNYIMVIVDDYSRYTWTLFIRSKDETPEVLKDFLIMIQRNLKAQKLVTSVANDISALVPQRQKAKDYDNSDHVPLLQKISPSANTTVPSQQELDLLFDPLYDEFFNAGTSSVNKSSSPTDNSNQQDTTPSTNIHPTSEPSTPKKFMLRKTTIIKQKINLPILSNKNDDDQTVIRNKARLVAKGYAQEEDGRENGILNGPLKEEVYVAQPDGFVDPDHLEKVYRLRKALYGLKQSLKSWYDELLHFLISKGFTKGDKLVSWMSKKQDCTVMSSAEAEYVALSAGCAQSAIAISCNPVQHSRTKRIHTRYHFIKEQVENGIIELYFVRTKYQLADMFTKALPEDRFQYLVRQIGMRCLTPAELEVLANESA